LEGRDLELDAHGRPTAKPPATGMFQVMPQSLRSNSADAEKNARWLPRLSRAEPAYSTESVSGRVVSRTVKRPVTSKRPSMIGVTDVLTKRSTG
jgi:hypothetical protein